MEPTIPNTTFVPLDPKIIGGEPVTIEKNQHVVSIRLTFMDYPFGAGHICGGSLFSPHKILTAAHCFVQDKHRKKFFSPNYYRVVMGSLNRFEQTANTIVISDTITYAYHPDYDMFNLYNDIAVMILSEGVPFSHPAVKPIPINTISPETGTACKVTGWGFTHYSLRTFSDVLLGANVDILDMKRCKEQYKNSWTQGMICAGDWTGAKDACSGDSGGGLVCNGLLVGVVSWGKRCGLADYPGIYSDVSYYRDWILSAEALDYSVAISYYHNPIYLLYSILLSLLSLCFINQSVKCLQ